MLNAIILELRLKPQKVTLRLTGAFVFIILFPTYDALFLSSPRGALGA